MLKETHEHIVGELQQNAKTDTVFVVTAVLFSLVVLGINWGVAINASRDPDPGAANWIFVVLMIATLLINGFSIRALLVGARTRQKLMAGLVTMYRDNGVDKYYDASMRENYATRYRLFIAALVFMGGISIIVPLIERVM